MTVEYEHSIDIAATPATVWAHLLAFEAWPEWTASMTKLERLDGGAAQVGSRVRVKQPRLPPTVMEITAIEPERSFSWRTKGPGAETVADHELTPTANGVRLTLRIAFRGPVGALMGRMIARMTRRYVRMEAEGLKRRAEA